MAADVGRNLCLQRLDHVRFAKCQMKRAVRESVPALLVGRVHRKSVSLISG